jgi:tellurite resistance protein
MAKKSGGGGVGLVLLGGVVALLAAIPREVWIVIGIAVAIGVVLHLVNKNKTSSQATPPAPDASAPIAPAKPGVRPAPAAHEPVSVYEYPGNEPIHRVPVAPAGFGNGSWIAPGNSVTVSGLQIPGGMLYVGTSLRTPSGRTDPCLIDLSKKVAAQADYTDRNLMGYWPSYSEVSPQARRAYLQWLAGGRQDPAADIGYVFLFFCGLERRAIVDGTSNGELGKAAAADLPAIAKEVRRLLGIYGNRPGSFQRYACEFLSMVELAALSDKLYQRAIPEFPQSYELPLYLRLALGQCAMDKVPVPPALALAWARMDPNIYLRTPATRCPEQFALVFQQKYQQLLPNGLVLPKNKTKLKFVYKPASAGLMDYGEIKLTFGETPDVAVLTGPVTKLREVAEAATTELDAYSRLLGRTPEAANTLEALLLLPPTLWPSQARQKLQDVAARTSRGMAVYKLQELASSLGHARSLERSTVTGLARALEALHVGMEPDVLEGAKTPKAQDNVVLFCLPTAEPVSRGGAAYQAAALTVQLAMAVALADGQLDAQEMRQLRQQIEGWSHLTPSNQQRLRAHMRYLMDAPPSLTVLKKKVEPLAAPAREAIARFMTVIAQADGYVSPAEIKMLEKVYKVLGLEPQKVFSDVHAAAAAAPQGTPATAAAPQVTPAVAKPSTSGFQLDAARIAALQQDTDKVSVLLSNIFIEEPAKAATPAPAEAVDPTAAAAPVGLTGLDAAHIAFVNHLISRPQWTREELLDLASDLDLMLDGALERINEAAFDAHDGPLTEGDDPVTINRDIMEKAPA